MFVAIICMKNITIKATNKIKGFAIVLLRSSVYLRV